MNLPAPKSSEFVARINALCEVEGDNADAWERLLQEIKVLKQTDAAIAWSLEGAAYAGMRKKTEAMYAFNNAMKLDKNRYIIRHNYAMALVQMGFYQSALEQAREAYRLTEGAPGDAKFACTLAFDAGQFATAREYLHVAKKLKADIDIETTTIMENAATFADESGWNDALISGYVEAALSVYRPAMDRHTRPEVSFGSDDGDGFFGYTLNLHEEQDVIAGLNRDWRTRAIDLDVPVSLLTKFAIAARSTLEDVNES